MIALRTRSTLSLTAASGKPTMVGFGIAWVETSTSTSHKMPSIPSNVTENSFASIRNLLFALMKIMGQPDCKTARSNEQGLFRHVPSNIKKTEAYTSRQHHHRWSR
jgi:hypothetical protein